MKFVCLYNAMHINTCIRKMSKFLYCCNTVAVRDKSQLDFVVKHKQKEVCVHAQSDTTCV